VELSPSRSISFLTFFPGSLHEILSRYRCWVLQDACPDR
jgi:hypothetical protein